MRDTYNRASAFWGKYELYAQIWANIVQKLQGKFPEEKGTLQTVRQDVQEEIKITTIWVRKVEQENVRAVASIALNEEAVAAVSTYNGV